VSATITLWNSTFGTCEEILEYPQRVADVLLRLRPIADIDLPSFPHSLEIEVSAEHRQPPTFPESQEDIMDFVSSTNIDLALPAIILNRVSRHQSTSIGSTKDLRSGTSIRPRDQTPESSKRKSKKQVSTPKLRHNDSQIQFETIESSPIADVILDSQLLTARQKEVKERQNAEAAAMFPDIRSTPLSKADSIQRRLSSASSSGGLPLHRSASKTRLLASPTIVRQSTPEPLGDFDAFLHSSPTPTRSLQASMDNKDPPSSPPESPKSRVIEFDIPSSPPEQASDPMLVSTTTEQPAAQVNPFDRTISTFDFTASDIDNNLLGITISPQNHAHVQTLKDASSSGTDTDLVSLKGIEIPQPETVSSKVLSTPNSMQKLPTVEKQTPKTPIFHDALENLVIPLPDKEADDDNFEDALSSPNLRPEQNKSSPFSEFDQSGMMKLMAGYDQEPGLPIKGPQSAEDGQEIMNKEASFRTDDGKTISSVNTELSAIQIVEVGKDAEVSSKVQVTSSLASVIPETPGTKVPRGSIIVDGDLYDPEDTIVVDVPDDIEEFPKPGRKRKFSISPRKRYRVFIEIPSRKRVKLEDGQDDENLVPESQLTSSQRMHIYLQTICNETKSVKESQSKKATPTKKRKSRGRLSKNSFTPSQADTSQQSDIMDSFLSTEEPTNFDTSAQSQEDLQSVKRASKSYGNTQESPDATKIDKEFREAGLRMVNGPAAEFVTAEKQSPILPQDEGVASTGYEEEDIEVTRDSPMGGTDDVPEVIDAGERKGQAPELSSEATREVSRDPFANKVAQIDVSMQTENVPETITSTGMAKSYLQSIFKFFSGAALTKEQAAAYEDQLDDAKEQLFGARRRGRELS